MATKTFPSLDDWLENVYVWPEGVPKDCTELDANERDCLERNAEAYCPSCAAFDKACEDYERDREQAEAAA